MNETGKPPCFECYRTGHDCNFAGSRRGGDYTHLRKSKNFRSRPGISLSESTISQNRNDEVTKTTIERREDKGVISGELKNPHDALQILSRVAAIDSKQPEEALYMQHATGSTHKLRSANKSRSCSRKSPFSPTENHIQDSMSGIKAYKLVEVGALEVDTIIQLVEQ